MSKRDDMSQETYDKAVSWYTGFYEACNGKFTPEEAGKVNPYDPEGLIE